VPELVAYAKKNPGKLTYGTTGIASSHHLNGEQLAMLTAIQLVHAPYKSTPVADAASGVLPLTFAIVAQAMPFIRSGKVRPLAMTTERRIRTLPDVPLMSEVVPGFDPTPAWTGLYGPARLPAPISKRVHEAVVAALSPADVQAKISDIGFDVALSHSPEDFAARLQRGIDLTARIVKAAKIEAQ
jgi:tripartite-type tricarboxylate transporter receptor subunit TctC